MADNEDTRPEDDDKVSDEDGSKLLDGKGGEQDDDARSKRSRGSRDDDDDADPEGADQLGDAGKRALAAIKEQRRKAREERDAAAKERDELRAWRKQQEDKNKSELERATSERDDYKTRAERAEAREKRRELAEELAPDHATAKQIAQVARRMQGDDDDALRADAEELFELLVGDAGSGKPPTKRTSGDGKPNGKPRTSSADDEDDGEMDPLKLAALVQRTR